MSCQIQLCEGITRKYDKNGILGDFNISSQYAISFLRTFTEYPSIICPLNQYQYYKETNKNPTYLTVVALPV